MNENWFIIAQATRYLDNSTIFLYVIAGGACVM